MMLICNHTNLHIELIDSLTKNILRTHAKPAMVTEMSTELHGRMKLCASEYIIEVPSNVQPCVATLIDRQCVALQLGSA